MIRTIRAIRIGHGHDRSGCVRRSQAPEIAPDQRRGNRSAEACPGAGLNPVPAIGKAPPPSVEPPSGRGAPGSVSRRRSADPASARSIVRPPCSAACSACLDARLSPRQNVGVRGCLIAIVIALSVLAFAEIRYDDRAPTAQRKSNVASGQLAGPPAPEHDVPAIISAAASTSATVQTVLVVESRRQLSPALSVFTVSRHLPVVAHSTGKPRFVPLLI